MYGQIFKLHSDLLKALSHPKRLEIIHLLRGHTLCVNEMLDMLGLPQANLSQHLAVLRKAGVVTAVKKGKHIHYKLAHPNFIKASDLIRTILIEKYKNTPLADEFTHKMSDLTPLVHDPVCHMRLSPKTAACVFQHHNHKLYFCAEGCYLKFKKNPKKYEDKI